MAPETSTLPDRPLAADARRRSGSWGWAVVVTSLVLVVMWIPIRRYSLGGTNAFALEPYRVLLVLANVGTVFALLSRTIRLQPIRFGIPLAIFVGALIASIVTASATLAEQGLVITSVGGLANLLFVLSAAFIVRQAVTSERRVLFLLKLLVSSGVVVAVGAIYERVTSFNVFLQLQHVLPVRLIQEAGESIRGGAARAYGSAQHPIALAVMLCLLLPIAVYLLRYSDWPRNLFHRRIVFALVTAVLLLGVLAAISRTGLVVLGVMFLMTMALLPRLGLIILSMAVPLFLARALIAPGTIDNTIGQFLDIDNLVASQFTSAGMRGAGRLADLGPTFAQIGQHPVFGVGFSSRIANGPNANGSILDDQVLAILLEAGVLGLVGFLAFFVVPAVLLLRYSFRTDLPPQHTYLAFAVAVSAAGYLAGAFFYDAFGFMQTLFVLGFELAVGAWLLTRRSAAGRWIESAAPGQATSLVSLKAG